MTFYYSVCIVLISAVYSLPQTSKIPKIYTFFLWLTLFLIGIFNAQFFDLETGGASYVYIGVAEYAVTSFKSIYDSGLDLDAIVRICGTDRVLAAPQSLSEITPSPSPSPSPSSSLACPNQRWFAEPLFFFPLFIFYWISGNIVVPIVIFDIICILSLSGAFWLFRYSRNFTKISNMELHDFPPINSIWMYFFVIGFFPVVVLYALYLRQFVSACFLILSFSSFISNNKKFGLASFVVAFLIHNSVLIFLPLIFILGGWRYKILWSFIAPIIIAGFVYLLINFTVAGNLKSNMFIGENIGLLYGLIIAFIGVFATFFTWKSNQSLHNDFLLCIIYISLIIASHLLFLQSGTIERLSLTSCFLIIFLLAFWSQDIIVLSPALDRVMLIIFPTPGLVYYFY